MAIRSFITEKWRKLIIPIAAIAVLSAVLFFPREPDSFSEERGQSLFEPIEPAEIIETTEPAELGPDPAPAVLLVDVKGAVKHPGLYSMKEGDRLFDAVEKAGGYTDSADTRLLNHAQKLSDEAVVYVPAQGEEPAVFETAQAASGSAGAPGNTGAAGGQVNINTADVSELQTLPGVGPSKAASIVQYREENGAFTQPEGLKNVSGIGDKTFEKLQSLITTN